MKDDVRTTMRVRIPLDERPALETHAYRRNIAYREFLVHVVADAVKRNYQPKSALPSRDTRLPMTQELKEQIRARARANGLAPEDWVLALLRDVANGDFMLEVA